MSQEVPRGLVATAVITTICVCGWVTFFMSAGFGASFGDLSTFYTDYTANAFVAGRTHLEIPQDHVWDTLYYEGKFYSYWGPVPALFLAAAKLSLSLSERVSDSVLVYCIALARTVVVSGLVVGIFLTWFRHKGWLSLLFGLLIVHLASPFPYTIGRAHVYEVNVLAAQLFYSLGLLLAFLAWTQPKYRALLMLLVGVAWALALGSRASYLVCIAASYLALAVLGYLQSQREGSYRSAVQHMACVVLPVFTAGCGLLYYNFVRFGSFVDFGLEYQKGLGFAHWSIRYLGSNLERYLFKAPASSSFFPYVYRGGKEDQLIQAGDPALWHVHWDTIGLVHTFPFVLFVAVGAFLCIRSCLGRGAGGNEAGRRAKGVAALFLPLLLVSLASYAPLALFWITSVRYMNDFMLGLAACSVMGYWLVEFPAHGAGRVLQALAVALGLYSLAVSLLLGFSGEGGFFALKNPQLIGEIRSVLDGAR